MCRTSRLALLVANSFSKVLLAPGRTELIGRRHKLVFVVFGSSSMMNMTVLICNHKIADCLHLSGDLPNIILNGTASALKEVVIHGNIGNKPPPILETKLAKCGPNTLASCS